jgi:hypothetical protein
MSKELKNAEVVETNMRNYMLYYKKKFQKLKQIATLVQDCKHLISNLCRVGPETQTTRKRSNVLVAQVNKQRDQQAPPEKDIPFDSAKYLTDHKLQQLML